ncbi:flagellar protein FliT [Nissabacter sp. SGAir0207]|uniref:flagellar protein FliT n=1 Tax=Nissabacter sp. SGAir0207 TaxID=2126321 RepID=UPI0010CCE504|nr:flagellar protein FliT [Nissabacter sp. SGAir0207]QCR35843.1 flagella biosynthesis regulatory protein FliT [Nissabacter sp. SGAir0207]
MDRHPHLITEYQLVFGLSEQMLALANQAQWQALVEMEIQYARQVERATALMAASEVPDPTQAAIRTLLDRTLANEAQVTQLLRARMDQLAELIGHTSRQKELSHAYGQFADRRPLF